MKHVLGIYVEGRLWRKVHLDDYPGFLRGEPITLGRRENCDVCIPNSTVSRKHAIIKFDGRNVWLVDQGSLNKFRIDGRICDNVKMIPGEKVLIGSSMKDPGSVVLMYIEMGGETVGSTSGNEIAVQSTSVKRKEKGPRQSFFGIAFRRLFAFMMDCVIVVFMCVGMVGVVAATLGLNGWRKYLLAAGIFLTGWFYFAFSESDKRGATFGKLVMGIGVKNNMNERIGFIRASCRLLCKILSIITLFLPIFGKGRCLHDIIVGTKVVKLSK